jgi:ABC-type sugar transport system permease subunit
MMTAAAISDAELRRARRRHRLRENAAAYVFLAPNLVFFAAFLVVPVLWVVRQSFLSGGVLGPATWVGLDNWREALADEDLRRSLWHTVLFTGMTVPAVLGVAMALALLLRGIGRGGALVRSIVYLPSLAPVVLAGLLWIFVVNPDVGLLNAGVRAVGAEPVNWLGDERLALPSIALLEVWRGTGFWALFLLAALLAVPRDLYDAAAIDGASAWSRFRFVTVPGIAPTLLVAVLLTTLVSMQVFDSVFVLTNGGPAGATDTAVLYIYRSVFESGDPGYGAVLSLVLMALIVALTLVIVRVAGRRTA